jgi:hypothetical protein
MNCQVFIERLGELASVRGLDEDVRQSAQAHAARCRPCAARLAAQQALNERLQEYAAATSQMPAPPARQRWQAALAEQRQVSGAPVAPVVELADFRAKRQLLGSAPRWTWLAAAAVLALAALTVIFWQRLGPVSTLSVSEEFSAAVPQPELVSPAPVVPPPPVMQPRETAQVETVVRRAPRRTRGLERAIASEESNAEFFPLTLAVDERALENRTVVRLEVPRARLVALGLPLPVHSDREMVNAEVMMGDNGVAYAIRVVR